MQHISRALPDYMPHGCYRAMEDDGRWGVLEKGRHVVPLKFSDVEYLDDTFYKVWKGGRLCGVYCTRKKSIVVPIKYEGIKCHTDVVFSVQMGHKFGLYDSKKKELILPIRFDTVELCSGFQTIVWKGGKCGIFNARTSKIKYCKD